MRVKLNNSNRLSKIIEKITGEKIYTSITGITTDSRECKPGDLYIALVGNRSDGHKYIKDVDSIKASAALVHKKNNDEKLNLQQILVTDTKKTLGEIAQKWRKHFNIPIIAITGSNGKTSTKDLLHHLLNSTFNVHATRGNYNTSIGVPLSLLELNENHSVSIIEMGANQPGDIKYLCEIANPTHGLITNISSAHLEGFQSIENIVKTKGALFKYLKNGLCFVNYTDEKIKSIKTKGDQVTYGFHSECDFPADIHHENDGSIILTINTNEINTNSKNLSFAKNIIAVSSIGITLGMEWALLQKRVLTYIPPKGRCNIILHNKTTIIDDTYNANLESCLAAIDYLMAFSGTGRKILVLGDMLELGEASNEQHSELGIKCSKVKIDAVFTLGRETKATHSKANDVNINLHFKKSKELINALKLHLKDDDTILFKGSRGMKMEKIISGVFQNNVI